MRQIPLTQGKVALVDDTDYEWLNCFKWYAHQNHCTFYAERNVSLSKNEHTVEYMHRLILGLQAGDRRQCDHRDGNGLNNCRSNLRVCTVAQNQRHQRLHYRNTTGFKGVTRRKRITRNPYIAQIQVNNKHIHLGYYREKNEAKKARLKAEKKYYGDFAPERKQGLGEMSTTTP